MRILRVLGAAAVALTIGSTAVRASTVEFAGTTTGCFGLSCSSKLGTLKFAGTSFDKSIVDPNTSVALNLGKFTLTSALFEPFDSIFDLTIHFTKPGTTTVNVDVDADVKGLVTFLAGVVHIDFDPETLSFGGKSYTLDISDVWLGTLGPFGRDTETLKGTITMTAAVPEASTWAMMILGFAGLGYMAYRRRQIGETVAAA
jgi:hypothetical protein